MAPNANEFKSVCGVEDMYYALVTQDDSGGYVAGTPKQLAPAIDVSLEPTSSLDTQYADNQPYDVAASEGETKISLNVTGIPSEILAELLGKVFDAASGRVFDAGGGATPPEVALGFRFVKTNGSYRYVWYLKGRFSPPKEEASTKTDKAEPKPQSATFTAIKTVATFTLTGSITDGVKRVFGDEDTTNFSATDWFTQVQTPTTTSVSALALSSSTPADDATNVSKTANQTLTYNNPLDANAIYNVALLDNTEAVVAATITIDATKKIITIDPTSSLAGSTAHKIVASVVDIYGQHLTSVVTFTTAA